VKRPAQDFCVVPVEHYVRFYRFVREKVRRDRGTDEPVPIMSPDQRNRLWENTVGFLTRGRERLKEYGVPLVRILFTPCRQNVACRAVIDIRFLPPPRAAGYRRAANSRQTARQRLFHVPSLSSARPNR
jgi:hypothetical protein